MLSKDTKNFNHPEKFDDYIVKEIIGEGGFAWVYKVWHPEVDVDMAVKHLKPVPDSKRSEIYNRFRKEARIGLNLNSNHVVRIHHFGNVDERPYLVMDYKKSGSLANQISGLPIPLSQSISYALDIAKGLKALHASEVLHRDLNPRNVLLNDDEVSCVISDFGLAGDLGQELKTPTGSPGYQSPEQERRKGYDERSDIYSWAYSLWQMLSGESNIFDLGETRQLSDLALQTPTIPNGIIELISECIEESPDARVQCTKTLIKRIESVFPNGLEGSPVDPNAIRDLLREIDESVTGMLESSDPIRPNIWNEFHKDDWLTAFDITQIYAYYELLDEYSNLTRSAGRGYRIDRWVRNNNDRISTALQSAKDCLNRMLVKNETKGH